MSNLLKHAMVMGVNDACVDRGEIQWPSPKVGFEMSQKLAGLLPAGEVPALEIAGWLKAASLDIAKAHGGPNAEAVLQMKTAASLDVKERASLVAEACMAKAASDNASLTSVGQNTPESAASTDQFARLDQKNRSTGKYNLGVGKTQMASGGIVGMQSSAGSVDVSNVMNSLTALDKQAALSAFVAALPEGAEKQAALKIATGEDGAAKMGLLKSLLEKLRGMGGDISGTAQAFGKGLTAPVAPVAKALYDVRRGGGQGPITAGASVLGEGMRELAGDPRLHGALGAATTVGGAIGAKSLYDRLRGGGGEAPAEDPSKQANEDMNAQDLGAGADPGAAGMAPGAAPQGVDPSMLERAMLFMRAMKDKIPGLRPSPEAQVAAGGLAQQGEPGMQVMAQVIDHMKTAEDAEQIIQEILQHQGQAGELASPELIQVIQQLMAEQGGEVPDEPKVAAFIERNTRRAPATPKTASEILASLKRASDGSLTNVGKNTPESAAKTDQTAKLDQENRSTNEYSVPQGKTKLPNKGQQLAVEPAPKAEDKTNPDTTPSRETKSAADVAYEAEFDKVASVYARHLPATLTVQQKVAAVQALMGMPPAARNEYVIALARG